MLAMVEIGNWLRYQLQVMGWSQSELARRADISTTAVSDLISGRRKLGKDTALAIAKAFGIPLDDVLVAAGDLQPTVNDDPIISEITHKTKQLDKAERLEILEFIKMKLRLSKGKNEKIVRTAK